VGIGRTTVWTIAALAAAAATSAAVYLSHGGPQAADEWRTAGYAGGQSSRIGDVRPGDIRLGEPRRFRVAAIGTETVGAVRGDFERPTARAVAPVDVPEPEPAAVEEQVEEPIVTAAAPPSNAVPDPQRADAPPAPDSVPAAEVDETGTVTPTLEGRGKPSKRGLVILHIGDSHTSADFLTGELRKRLQARYGRGAPGYITAGHPHIGVRTSSLKVTASSGWTYKSLQKPDAATSEFWLSGYNAIASAPNETMSFSSEKPQQFDTIEIEVVRQPHGGTIDVKLDGVVETSYDLSSARVEPVVIRLMPARAATEKVREISITTKGHGPVMLASIAIYNRQAGLTYNSVGYPGAQASLVNKFNTKLLANDLIRINPQIVVLSFGTNEASNESLDIANYKAGYERIVEKIKAVLPSAQIVVISPPDFSEQGSSGKKKDGKASGVHEANAGSSDCAWHTPAKLAQIREAQREVAQHQGLVYWNWASIMPSECGAHRWFTASPPLMAKDHVHFTVEGYKKSAEQFLNTLIPVIEKVRVSANVVPNN
jgi:lysophospholipase L1-like esterase